MYIFTLSKYTYTHLQNNTHLNSKQTNFQTLTNTHKHTHTHTHTHTIHKKVENGERIF